MSTTMRTSTRSTGLSVICVIASSYRGSRRLALGAATSLLTVGRVPVAICTRPSFTASARCRSRRGPILVPEPQLLVAALHLGGDDGRFAFEHQREPRTSIVSCAAICRTDPRSGAGPHDVPLHEEGVGGELKALGSMRLQPKEREARPSRSVEPHVPNQNIQQSGAMS